MAAAAATPFEFAKWIAAVPLIPTTQRLLNQQGLNVEELLLQLTDAEVIRLGLPIGQELRLRTALCDLGNVHVSRPSTARAEGDATESSSFDEEETYADAQAPVPQPAATAAGPKTANASALNSASDSLDSFLKALPNDFALDPAVSAPASKPSRTSDPRMLLTVRVRSKKAEKIVNFLPERTRERIQRRKRERLVLSHSEDGTITFKPGEDECYSLTVSEWAAANMRLLSHILRQGDLAYSDVELYLSYTMQIHELADRFEWASVVEFDTRYRELQAEYAFDWGDMHHCTQFHILQTKRHTPNSHASVYSGARHPPAGPADAKEDCKKWLASGGKNCPFGKRCRYAHRRPQPDTDTSASKNSQ